MPSPVTADALRSFPLFATVAEGSLDAVAAAARPVQVPSGGVVFRQGDPAAGLYCVRTGLVSLLLSSPSGTEKVVELVGSGEQFAEAVVFSGAPYPVEARALVDSELLLCPARVLLDLVERDPGLARAMLAGLAMRLHRLLGDLESYTLRSATQRVVAWLLRQRPPASAGRGGYAVRLPTTKAVLASRIGVAPETLSRVLRALAEGGAVSTTGRVVRVHSVPALTAQLGRMSDGDGGDVSPGV